MIGALLSGLFNLILTLLSTIVQIVLLPLNLLFSGVFPDLTDKIAQVVQGLADAMHFLGWAIAIIPPVVRVTMLFIFGIEVTLFVVIRSTTMTAKLWKVLQKLKLW